MMRNLGALSEYLIRFICLGSRRCRMVIVAPAYQPGAETGPEEPELSTKQAN